MDDYESKEQQTFVGKSSSYSPGTFRRCCRVSRASSSPAGNASFGQVGFTSGLSTAGESESMIGFSVADAERCNGRSVVVVLIATPSRDSDVGTWKHVVCQWPTSGIGKPRVRASGGM
jgi:hypothetical protein